MAETDLFFHLRIGQTILETHSIPFKNLYSFTWPDHTDPDLAWLFQVTVALLYKLKGFSAIVWLKAVLVTAASALIYRSCRRAGAGSMAASLAVAATAMASAQRIVERPHLITFVGIGALLLILIEIENGRRRLIWILPILTLVWANFHAGVFFCPLIFTLYWTGKCIDDKKLDRSIYILPLILLATFASPAGAMLPKYLLWHTGLGATRNIEEFRRAEPWSDPWFFVELAGCALAALVLRRKTPVRLVLPIVVVAALAFRSVRFVAEWAHLAAPLVALGLHPLVDGRAWRKWAAVFALLAVVTVERATHPTRIGLAGDVVPFDAITFATQNGLRERMYSDLDVGCYLLWEGWPRYRVFQDARLPAYPDEFHRALDETPPAAFDSLLRNYGVDAALVGDAAVNMRAGSFDPDEWALVYRRADALVFARRGAHEQAIARFEIPLRVRFNFQSGASVEPLTAPPARSPVGRCEWQRRLAAALDEEGDPSRALDARERALDGGCLPPDEEAHARFLLGARAQLAGRLDEAASQYDRVLQWKPDSVDALVNRAFARLAKDPASARADFTRALALDPSRADAREGLRRLP